MSMVGLPAAAPAAAPPPPALLFTETLFAGISFTETLSAEFFFTESVISRSFSYPLLLLIVYHAFIGAAKADLCGFSLIFRKIL
jgi:hypothetical protein